MRDKAKCRVAGWGKTKTGRSDVLQVVEVPIINLKTCKTEWDQIEFKLPDNVICAGGYDTNKGFCQVCFIENDFWCLNGSNILTKQIILLLSHRVILVVLWYVAGKQWVLCPST